MEGPGSTYWCEMKEKRSVVGQPPEDKLTCEELIAGGGSIVLIDIEASDDKELILDMKAAKHGIELMAKKQFSHFADIVNEDDDSTTADIWLQLALLGDVIYG
jgi:hypothetical protein